MRSELGQSLKSLVVVVMVSVGLAACGGNEGPEVIAENELDTPQSNYSRGQVALERGETEKAIGFFKRSVELDKAFQAGWIALVDVSVDTGKFSEARTYLKSARDNDPNDNDELRLNTSEIRMIVARAATGWQKDADRLYRRSVRAVKGNISEAVKGDLYVAGGDLYRQTGDLEKAREAYTLALPTGGEYRAQGTAGLQELDRLARAGVSGGRVAVIAAKDSISRHDVIVLLTQETDLDAKIAEMIGVRERAGEKAPDGGADYLDDALADEILRVNRFGFRFPKITGGRFEGEKSITRAEFAMLLEDMLSTLERDRDMKRKFIGSVTPFKDVTSSNPAFNAFMTVVSRGLYPAVADGYARPNDPVSGALAVEALRQLGQ